MKTLTVRLPEPVAAEIEAESRRRGISKSDVVRERLRSATGSQRRPPSLEAIAHLIGSVDDDLPEDPSARKKQSIISERPAMAANALADAGFLVALVRRRDRHHRWAKEEAKRHPPPWMMCEAVHSKVFHMPKEYGAAEMGELLDLGTMTIPFVLAEHCGLLIQLMNKYAQLPMSLADACLVRMSEVVAAPLVLTTDADFRIYRRDGRPPVPRALPS